MSGAKPLASISLDLDNQWAYMRVHGDAGWESFPSYFDLVAPRILDVLRSRSLQITFFVVGQDAALARNHAALRAIVADGHEIANHSFHHLPSIRSKALAEVTEELRQAEEAIGEATGEKVAGYRAPAFALSTATLQALAQRGYLYDASTFPTSIGPLARKYYQSTQSRGRPPDTEQQGLYGGWKDAVRPLRPYYWQLDSAQLLEIPVTTFPGLRTPVHFTYLLFLLEKSRVLARLYFQAALAACAFAGVSPSLLLHPLDFLGGEEVPALRFFPGMKLPGAQKTEFVEEALAEMSERFTLCTMAEHSRFAVGSDLRKVLETP